MGGPAGTAGQHQKETERHILLESELQPNVFSILNELLDAASRAGKESPTSSQTQLNLIIDFTAN